MQQDSSFKTGEFFEKLSLGVLDGATQVLSAKYSVPQQTDGRVSGPAGQAMPVSAGVAGDNMRLLYIGGGVLAIVALILLVKK